MSRKRSGYFVNPNVLADPGCRAEVDGPPVETALTSRSTTPDCFRGRSFNRERCVPVYDLVSNWASMVMAALAWNLKSRFAMMMHLNTDRRKYVAMEFRTFVREMILLPCQVIRRARRTTLRIIGWQPSADRLFSAWRNDRTDPVPDRIRLTPRSLSTLPARPAAPLPGPVSPAAKMTSEQPEKPAPKSLFILLKPRDTASCNAYLSPLCRFTPWKTAPVAYSLVLGLGGAAGRIEIHTCAHHALEARGICSGSPGPLAG